MALEDIQPDCIWIAAHVETSFALRGKVIVAPVSDICDQLADRLE